MRNARRLIRMSLDTAGNLTKEVLEPLLLACPTAVTEHPKRARVAQIRIRPEFLLDEAFHFLIGHRLALGMAAEIRHFRDLSVPGTKNIRVETMLWGTSENVARNP